MQRYILVYSSLTVLLDVSSTCSSKDPLNQNMILLEKLGIVDRAYRGIFTNFGISYMTT